MIKVLDCFFNLCESVGRNRFRELQVGSGYARKAEQWTRVGCSPQTANNTVMNALPSDLQQGSNFF